MGFHYLQRVCTRQVLLLGLCCALLAGCSSHGPLTMAQLEALGKPAGFRPIVFNTGTFRLAGMLKDNNTSQPEAEEALVVYLEGDGRAVTKNRAARNPTPRRAQAYELALQDPSPHILYLARIGQYQPQYSGVHYQEYWTSHRLGEEAVVAAGNALDQALALTGATQLHLVGYSGGGGLAALVAQRRQDVASLVTIAGLLDTDWWTMHGGYKPLRGLNPVQSAATLDHVPQLHFFGLEDTIIPEGVSASYVQALPSARVQRIGIYTDHWALWTDIWPELLQQYILPLRHPQP